MTESMFLIQVLQFMLSSFLVFGSTALLIEAILYLGNIKNSRLRALARYIPILKLPIDLILYGLSACAYITNFNPLNCQSYLEKLIAQLFRIKENFSGLDNTMYPVADYLHTHIPAWGLETAFIGVWVAFFGMVAHKLFVVIGSFKRLKKICADSAPINRSITNVKLREKLQSKKINILLSDEVPAPTAALKNYILFPKEQYHLLSQDEFEAIIAHELEHLTWYDPLLKFISSLTGSFFWWLPTKWWLKRLEEEQEYASDASTDQYGLDHQSLASAIMKISKNTREKERKLGPLSYLTHHRPFTLRRLDELLDVSPKPPIKFYRRRLFIAAAAGLALLAIFRIC